MQKIEQTKRLVFYVFILLLIFSCSKDNDIENSNIYTEQFEEYFVDLSQAKEIAEGIFFKNKTNSTTASKSSSTESTTRTVETINEIKSAQGRTSFYVINYNEGGYILLSADNRIQPILAFSENNEFNIDENLYPPGLKFWMNDTKKQITDIQHSNIEQSEKIKFAWDEVETALETSSQSMFAKEGPIEECYEHTEIITVGPLLNSTWYQTGGFNSALSYITCNNVNSHVLAGCVIIAMGQVMKYYQHPTNYNWSSMPLTYGTTTTANFIADIHDAIGNEYSGNPVYNCDGTGVSSSANMGIVLKNQFNYSYASSSNYNYNTVKSNLNNNRPVILSGHNGTGVGHMWVCDGYQQLFFYFDDCTGGYYYPLFHMNWGWGGEHDAYYSYNNFNPDDKNYNSDKK
jgi:hypothetical protein